MYQSAPRLVGARVRVGCRAVIGKGEAAALVFNVACLAAKTKGFAAAPGVRKPSPLSPAHGTESGRQNRTLQWAAIAAVFVLLKQRRQSGDYIGVGAIHVVLFAGITG